MLLLNLVGVVSSRVGWGVKPDNVDQSQEVQASRSGDLYSKAELYSGTILVRKYSD